MNLASFGYVSSIGIALSYFACTLGSLNAGARILYYFAQNRLFVPSFGSAHPVNKTPHRGIALIAVIAIACPATLLLSKVQLPDCINYLTQLASYGFIGAYFLVCLAMPFFLLRRKILRRLDVAVSVAALLILAAVLALSVFPVPAAPWRYLPYLFLAALLIGIAVSIRYARRGTRLLRQKPSIRASNGARRTAHPASTVGLAFASSGATTRAPIAPRSALLRRLANRPRSQTSCAPEDCR